MGQFDGFVLDGGGNHNETALSSNSGDFVLVANTEFVYQGGIGPDVYQIDDSNRAGWIALYVITAVVAVLGNLLFLLATSASGGSGGSGAARANSSHKRAYWLLVSLSFRDLLMVGFCLPLTLLPELVYGTWPWNADLCLAYTAVYQCLVILLPLTLIFLSWHLFAENLKWKSKKYSSGRQTTEVQEESKLQLFYLPLIWLLALLFALPTAWHAGIVDQHDTDFHGNKIFIKANNSKICKYPSINAPLDLDDGINDDLIPLGNTIATFWMPMALMVVPWFGLLVQASGFFGSQLKTRAFRMSLIVVLMVVVYEGSHVWLATYDLHALLTTSVGVATHHPFLLRPFLRFGQSWLVVMKWSIFLPSALNPILYLLFSADVQAGLHAFCRKICPCCKRKSRNDSETTRKLLPHETDDPQKKLSIILNKSINDPNMPDRFSIES